MQRLYIYIYSTHYFYFPIDNGIFHPPYLGFVMIELFNMRYTSIDTFAIDVGSADCQGAVSFVYSDPKDEAALLLLGISELPLNVVRSLKRNIAFVITMIKLLNGERVPDMGVNINRPTVEEQ